MSVPRIQPSQAYVQDELRRIQDNLANAIDKPGNSSPVPMYMGSINGSVGTGAITVFQTGNNGGSFVVSPPYAGNVVGVSIDLRTTSAGFSMPVYVQIASTQNNVGTWKSPSIFVTDFASSQYVGPSAYPFKANDPIYCSFGPPSATLSNVVATCFLFVTFNAS